MKKIVLLFSVLFFVLMGDAQQSTYCNPVNIDYGYTPIPNFSEWGRHRATADPVIVNYKGDYYLFSTNQWGYWWSSDRLNWNYISKRFRHLLAFRVADRQRADGGRVVERARTERETDDDSQKSVQHSHIRGHDASP